MRIPRFRIRTLIVLVSVTAMLSSAAMYTARLHRISLEHRERVAKLQQIARQKELHRISLEHLRRVLELQQHIAHQKQVKTWADNPQQCSDLRPFSARIARDIQYSERLKVKYERAARYPWLPVDSDPEEPK